MENHKHFELCKKAYYWSSFSPEKRAVEDCVFYEEIQNEFKGDEYVLTRFERLFLAWIAAQSRCASVMITGPAKFPTERNNKARGTERKRCEEMMAFLKKARKHRDKKDQLEAKKNVSTQEINVSTQEIMVGTVRVVQNMEDNRLQLFFPGKPDYNTIQLLKKNGFKWAPSLSAWQRQLTSNALFAFKNYVRPKLQEI